MGINGISGIQNMSYTGFRSDARIASIPDASLKVKENNLKTGIDQSVGQNSPSNTSSGYLIEEVSSRPAAPVDLGRLSLTFNKNEDFSYIGRDKNINNMDMEKAISDMRQDSILQEYQFFVGNASNVFSSEDGKVIAKLN